MSIPADDRRCEILPVPKERRKPSVTTAKATGPTWQIITMIMFTILTSLVGLLYSINSQRIERAEEQASKSVEKNHDQDKTIVEMRTDLGYVKRSQDDLQQDMHKALEMLSTIQQGAKQ